MRAVRETCIAGNIIDVTIKVPSGNHKGKRKNRMHVTSEKVQKNNDRLTVKKIARMIHANFNKRDSHDTLTYATEPTLEEAKKNIDNFLARTRRKMKKLGLDFKWIITTEYLGERLHHHLITNAPLEIINETWKSGFVFSKELYAEPNRTKLAEYIIKESKNTFKLENSPFKTRYSHARNLIIPETRVEDVSENQLWADPKPLKGYYIDRDSIRRYEHPITGLEHLEYIMISLEEEPRLKKYYKGKKKKHNENYKKYINHIEEQECLFR